MAYELCLATAGKQVPDGPDWIHEVKHDGYRMLVIRENERVRLLSRNGTDWTKRYPWIAEAALKNRQKRFVIDGEAVILGVDGISDFNALHSRLYDHEVQLYAFDILVMGGDDLRSLPLHPAQSKSAAALGARPDGISVAPFERGEIGSDLFRAACRMGLEGLVSKHRDRPYRGGRQKHWIKVKNRSHPAMDREL
ncbi:DNA ligase [Bradyrhizobium genosp. SA-3]|uniref:ATP-dependent DNA ligase n=1 Tax=Bradyrhizobium genosp. SA-3 TaxID=508868 RepID=UPI001028F267|nr:DNA ligase [Bradyrhizobium genosp. SA-3]